MSRHRNFRAINYDEEYDEYFENSYSQSYDDDYGISPRTEAQFIFNRNERSNPRLPLTINEATDGHNVVQKKDEDMSFVDDDEKWENTQSIYSDLNHFLKDQKLSSVEKGQLVSCVEELQNTVGDTVSESILVEKALKHRFNLEKALNDVLNDNSDENVDIGPSDLNEKWKVQSDLEGNFDEILGSLMTDKINLDLNDQTTLKRQDVDSKSEMISNEIENNDFESLFLSDIPLSISHLSSSPSFGTLNQSISNNSLQISKLILEESKVNPLPDFFLLSNELESHKVALKEPSKLMLILTSKHIQQLKPKACKVRILDLITHYNSQISKSVNFTCTSLDLNSKKFKSFTTPVSNGALKIEEGASSLLTPKPKVTQEVKRNCSSERREFKAKPSNATDKGSSSKVVLASKQIKTVSRNEMIEQFNQLRIDRKPLINLVIIGHVDAGKSTLIGHLLYMLGCISQKNMHRYETDSKKIGKASFLYAWILDETEEERSRGITMDIAQSKFETENKMVNVLDAPGHRDFIPNMITGAAQADAALLVVDATCGEFEAGYHARGQTREHTLLIRSLGVSQVAVVINKLDNVKYSQERYLDIISKLTTFLKQAGFKEQDVTFVPCSGLTGENLTTRCQVKSLSEWYNGPCLLEVIDSFKEPERLISKPFRLIISNIFKGVVAGVCVSGKIETGAVQIGQKLIAMPLGEQCIVKAISVDDMTTTQAFAGDQVMITLSNCDQANINPGSVLCDITDPSPVVTQFEARIVMFNDVQIPITKGYPVEFHYKSLCEQAVIKRLLSQVNKSTGEEIKKNPRCLTKNSSGIIEIEMARPISIELYQNFKDLGRFMIRSRGSTIAAGLVTKLL